MIFIDRIKNRWSERQLPKDSKAKDRESLQHEIDVAKKEWNYAQQNFNFVDDDKQIDHYIYLIECAEKRYMYLIKKAREIKMRERSVCK